MHVRADILQVSMIPNAFYQYTPTETSVPGICGTCIYRYMWYMYLHMYHQ